MKLYYTPGACSLADHIALIEAGLPHDLVKVDLKTKTTEDGADFTTINPKGYVPAIGLDEGGVLTENIALLSYIADRSGTLLPADGIGRYRVLETTAFVSTELHKNFHPFFNPAASDAEREEARETLTGRFALVDDMVGTDGFVVGDAMSIADCYLFVMLTWAPGKAKLDLPANLRAYHDRIAGRDAVAQALREEGLA